MASILIFAEKERKIKELNKRYNQRDHPIEGKPNYCKGFTNFERYLLKRDCWGT